MLRLRDLHAWHGSNASFILGGLLQNVEPIRQPRKISELAYTLLWDKFDGALFPPFMGWPGYALSKRAAKDLVKGTCEYVLVREKKGSELQL